MKRTLATLAIVAAAGLVMAGEKIKAEFGGITIKGKYSAEADAAFAGNVIYDQTAVVTTVTDPDTGEEVTKTNYVQVVVAETTAQKVARVGRDAATGAIRAVLERYRQEQAAAAVAAQESPIE